MTSRFGADVVVVGGGAGGLAAVVAVLAIVSLLLFWVGVYCTFDVLDIVRERLSASLAIGEPPEWWTQPQDPNRINTAGWEDSPYLSHDGKRLYFMYTPFNFFPTFTGGSPQMVGPDRPGHIASYNGNPYMDSDTYVSERQPDGKWSPPRPLGFNHHFTDSCGMMNRDGSRFYYLTQTQPQPIDPTIHVVDRRDDGSWGQPVDLGFALKQPPNHMPDTNPHVSTDERTIWFTSRREGGYGGSDLWSTTRQPDDTWSQPSNMGPQINTDQDEDQIWVSPDGRTACFNRGMLVYQTENRGGAWQPAQPVHIPGVTMAAEVSFTDDMQTMCFAVPDMQRKDITIMVCHRLPDGRWSRPEPVD